MRVHFTSIGGSVMHQLAIALKKKGYVVTGTDDEIYEPARSALKAEGLLPDKDGWDPSKITPDLDAVILGMHAKADNPELIKAQELGLKIYSFPSYIFNESKDKKRIVVGGSHGKTTTTSMIMHVLKDAGKDFDYMVGARLKGFNQSVSITNAPLIVCEGDEYPASVLEKKPKFHFLHPHIAILTGIAWDHINVFPSFENYLEQFRIFISKIEPGGVLIYFEEDPELKKLVESCKREDLSYLPYGLPKHEVSGGKTKLFIEDASAEIQVFGDHNLLNIHAAWLACKQTGVTAVEFCKAIAKFQGASRRLELVAEGNDIKVFRDFAHAPSKLKATIEAVKKQFPDRKIVAVFELHTYSSLNAAFLSQYAKSMDPAHEAAVCFSHHALEIKRLPPLSKEEVFRAFEKPGLEVLTNRSEIENWLNSRQFHHSVLLLMSSGDFDGMDILTFARKITHQQS